MGIEVTCKCGRNFVVADEYAGLEAECEHCGTILEIPDAPQGVGAAPLPQASPRTVFPSAMADTCPSCSSPMSEDAIHCSRCGRILQMPLSPEQQASLFSEMTGKLDDYLSDPANLDADAKARGGTFGAFTKVCAVSFLVSVGLIAAAVVVVAFRLPVAEIVGDVAVVVGFLGAFFSFFPAIISGSGDYARGHMQDCENPAKAFRRYLAALHSGKFKKAFYALGPWARNVGPVDTVAFSNIPLPKGPF